MEIRAEVLEMVYSRKGKKLHTTQSLHIHSLSVQPSRGLFPLQTKLFHSAVKTQPHDCCRHHRLEETEPNSALLEIPFYEHDIFVAICSAQSQQCLLGSLSQLPERPSLASIFPSHLAVVWSSSVFYFFFQ